MAIELSSFSLDYSFSFIQRRDVKQPSKKENLSPKKVEKSDEIAEFQPKTSTNLVISR